MGVGGRGRPAGGPGGGAAGRLVAGALLVLAVSGPAGAASGVGPAEVAAGIAALRARQVVHLSRGDLAALVAGEDSLAAFAADAEESLLEEALRPDPPADLASVLWDVVSAAPDLWLARVASGSWRDRERIWDPSGRLSVFVAAYLLREGRPSEARDVLVRRIVPREDRAYRDLLLIEAADGEADSSTAGAMALRIANGDRRHPFWSDLAIRGALHLFHNRQYEAAWGLLKRREADAEGSIRSMWLAWRIASAAPRLVGDEETKALLLDLLGENLNNHQINRLADASDKWLEDGWRPPPERLADLLRLYLRADRQESLRRLHRLAAGSGAGRAAEIVGLTVDAWRRAGRVEAALALADSFLALPGAAGSGRVLLARERVHRSLGDLEAMGRDAWAHFRDLEADREGASLALWEYGREIEDAGRFREALTLFRTLAAGAGDRWPREAALRVGILQVAMDEPSGALAWWDSLGIGGSPPVGSNLPRLDVDPEMRGAALYWRGRALEILGRGEDADAAWGRAATGSPPTFYSWLAGRAAAARARTGSSVGLWDELHGEVLSAVEPGDLRSRPAPGGRDPLLPEHWEVVAARCRVWLEVGRGSWCAREWGAAGWDDLDRESRALLGFASGEAARGLLSAFRVDDADRRRLLSHPPVFASILVRESLRRGVSPFLIWAVMRQESAMDRHAVSRAGAVGLLQLMPGTALEVGRKWGLEPAPLTNPGVNIPLGVAHLREALEGGVSVPEALAAYNAGPEALARWRAREQRIDLFIERIGYGETRDYVRRVLRDYGAFRDLYGAP